MFPLPTPTDPEKARRDQLATITRKFLLGDNEANRISEEHGTSVAQHHAQVAAGRMGRCDCARSDGIICARLLMMSKGPKCYPCWSNSKDGRACDHSLRGKPNA